MIKIVAAFAAGLIVAVLGHRFLPSPSTPTQALVRIIDAREGKTLGYVFTAPDGSARSMNVLTPEAAKAAEVLRRRGDLVLSKVTLGGDMVAKQMNVPANCEENPEQPSTEAGMKAVACPEGFEGQWTQFRDAGSCTWAPAMPQDAELLRAFAIQSQGEGK